MLQKIEDEQERLSMYTENSCMAKLTECELGNINQKETSSVGMLKYVPGWKHSSMKNYDVTIPSTFIT